MLEKVMSSVGASVAKAITAASACANAVVCQFAKNAIDLSTRYYLMAISVALLLVMMASFIIVGRHFVEMLRNEAQNGVHVAA